MSSPQREIMVVAGEPSGDLHAGRLIQALTREVPALRVFGMGGTCIREAGAEILHDIASLAVIGFGGIPRILPRLRVIRRDLLARVRDACPEAVILVDYPGFNLHLARALTKLPRRPRLIYFIPPQVWAWWRGRARTIARNFDLVLTILPFEPPYFIREGGCAEFVGSPVAYGLRDAPPRGEARRRLGVEDNGPVVALLPGSRPREIEHHAAEMFGAAHILRKRHPSAVFLVSEAEALEEGAVARRLVEKGPGFRAIRGRTHELIRAADAAIVVSGTASFETCLLGTPMIVVYRSDYLSYMLAKYLFSLVDYISLANLMAGRELVPELYQRQVRAEVIARAVSPLLEDSAERRRQIEGFEKIRASLSGPDPYEKAARRIRRLWEAGG